MDNDPQHPLQNEAAARKKWRGEDEGPVPSAPGHTLPASEDQDERMESGGDSGSGPPGTIRPPD
jgi:hypothetical protein